jgi:hypothetical protein
MGRMKNVVKSLALVTMMASPLSYAASTSLIDNFEAENAHNNVNVWPQSSHSIYNFNSFANWEVTDGTVDLKAWDDPYTSSCYNNSNYCVDLDGSSRNAGVLTTKEGFSAGTYQVSFALSGNQRGGSDDITVQFGAGSLISNLIIDWDAAWTTYSFVISLLEGDKLSFANLGGDNVGVLLDDVSVSAVPVPAAAFLFAPALVGFMSLRRKAKKA